MKKEETQTSEFYKFHLALRGFNIINRITGMQVFKFEAWFLNGGEMNDDTRRIMSLTHPYYKFTINEDYNRIVL